MLCFIIGGGVIEFHIYKKTSKIKIVCNYYLNSIKKKEEKF